MWKNERKIYTKHWRLPTALHLNNSHYSSKKKKIGFVFLCRKCASRNDPLDFQHFRFSISVCRCAWAHFECFFISGRHDGLIFISASTLNSSKHTKKNNIIIDEAFPSTWAIHSHRNIFLKNAPNITHDKRNSALNWLNQPAKLPHENVHTCVVLLLWRWLICFIHLVYLPRKLNLILCRQLGCFFFRLFNLYFIYWVMQIIISGE